MKSCVICLGNEPGPRKPDPDVEYICSACVQILAHATQEEIVDLYLKAVEQGMDRKAEVLKSFIYNRAILKTLETAPQTCQTAS